MLSFFVKSIAIVILIRANIVNSATYFWPRSCPSTYSCYQMWSILYNNLLSNVINFCSNQLYVTGSYKYSNSTSTQPSCGETEQLLAWIRIMPGRGSFLPLYSDWRMSKGGVIMFAQFEANPNDHQAVVSKKPPLGPPGWGREVRSSLSPLSFGFSPNHKPPTQCAVKPLLTWEAQNPFLRKMRLFQQKQPQKL